MYSRLSKNAAVDFNQLKQALLKRYDLTENGFRVRFRDGESEDGERARAVHNEAQALFNQVG